MSSVVVLPCWIHDSNSYYRHVRWLRYMERNIKPRLKYSKIILLDNASDMKFLKKLDATVFSENFEFLNAGRSDLFVIRFENHLSRKAVLDYPYWYRAIYFILKLHENAFFQADKYYHIDSDNYIQTNEMLEYMKNSNTGWTAFWNEVHNFPTSELFVLNEDSLPLLRQLANTHKYDELAGKLAEWVLPFTHIEKSFKGGRYAESGKYVLDADFVGQVVRGYKVKFRG